MRAMLLLVLLGVGCTPGPTPPLESAVVPAPTAAARRWFLRARVAEGRGDTEEAERALRWLVREDPRRPESHDHLGAFLERERRWEEAVDAWGRSRTLNRGRWEPHAALARLAARAGDAGAEQFHLGRAVDLGGPPAVHERLFALQFTAGDPAAARTLDRWLGLVLTDPVDRMRRARAAREQGQHGAAVTDLIAVADTSDRTPDVASLIWDSARQSCRHRTALQWARRAPLGDRGVERTLRDVALQLGDPVLLRRLTTPESPAPAVGLHAPWPAPALPLEGEVDPRVQLAEQWRRARRPQLALAALADAPGGWASLIRAYALISAGRPVDGWAEASVIPKSHPAWLRGQVLGLGLGRVTAPELQERMGADGGPAVAAGAAELFALPGVDPTKVVVRGLPVGQGQVPDALVRIPAEGAEALETIVLEHDIAVARAGGHRREAERLARVWTERRPEEPRAWVNRAQVDPESADRWLDRALALSPCHAEALLLRAHHAPADEALVWLRAAEEAAPFSASVFEALAQRGLERR